MFSSLAPFVVGGTVTASAALAIVVLSRHVNRESYRSLPAWAVTAGVAAFAAVLWLSALLARQLG